MPMMIRTIVTSCELVARWTELRGSEILVMSSVGFAAVAVGFGVNAREVVSITRAVAVGFHWFCEF